MATFDPAYAAAVKDSGSALVGIAQVRIASVTSMRASMAAPVIAAATPLTAVGKSTTLTDSTDGVTKIVRAATPYAVNVASTLPVAVAAAGYTGNVDGCFILVAESATVCSLYAPDGTKTTGTLAIGVITVAAVMGVTISGTVTGTTAGDTWVLPVTSATAQNATQTGIISPYSMFKGSLNSVGGLLTSSWDPKVDTLATMPSGFPAQIVDSIVAKVSAGIKFEAQEATNIIISTLVNMADAIMTVGDIQAIAAEIVFRNRAGNLQTYWCPSCTLPSVPTIAATNDFSKIAWDLSVNDQVESGATGTYAAWLRNAPLYYRLSYMH